MTNLPTTGLLMPQKVNPAVAMRQIARIFKESDGLECLVDTDGTSFASKPRDLQNLESGILSASGSYLEAKAEIAVRLELVRCPASMRMLVAPIFDLIGSFNDTILPSPAQGKRKDECSFWVMLNVKAEKLGQMRENALLAQIQKLAGIAKALQADLPAKRSVAEITKQFADIEDILSPLETMPEIDLALLRSTKTTTSLFSWVDKTASYSDVTPALAIACESKLGLDFVQEILAGHAAFSTRPLGQLMLPSLSLKGLIDLARKAPGPILIPAIALSLGSSPYELKSEIQCLLNSLAQTGNTVLFTGTMAQLQNVFASGQDGSTDPFQPLLRHVPPIATNHLIRFAVHQAARQHGGVGEDSLGEISARIGCAIAHLHPLEQSRLLTPIARKVLSDWSTGKTANISHDWIMELSKVSETLSGLSVSPRAKRSASVQDNFSKVLTDEKLMAFLQQNLLAQDDALRQLTSRLATEALTRPLHQPLRFCSQGTPGTGKSESCALLAQQLGIPHENIDAASFSDAQTASSQLLGSGRGIVMSHQAGRLEEAARHQGGVLLEISDLDHARPDVRTAIADIFLKALETGEVQGATGNLSSCANVIFAFTMNLPGGTDEDVRKASIGFGKGPTQQQVAERVTDEIKLMFSSAFISRVGTPILFDPLSGPALAELLEQAMHRAVMTSAERLPLSIDRLDMAPDLGTNVIKSLTTSITASGARGILEHGRAVAAQAVLDYGRSLSLQNGMREEAVGQVSDVDQSTKEATTLVLCAGHDGTAILTPA